MFTFILNQYDILLSHDFIRICIYVRILSILKFTGHNSKISVILSMVLSFWFSHLQEFHQYGSIPIQNNHMKQNFAAYLSNNFPMVIILKSTWLGFAFSRKMNSLLCNFKEA